MTLEDLSAEIAELRLIINHAAIDAAQKREKDASVWAVPYIRIVAGEFALFLMKLQPKPKTCFVIRRKYTSKLRKVAGHIGLTYSDLLSVFGDVINERNGEAHCSNWIEVNDKLNLCMYLFTEFTTLQTICAEHFLVISNATIFKTEF